MRWRRPPHPGTTRARDDRGATAVEYGLIMAGVAVLAVPALLLIQSNSGDTFETTVGDDAGVTVCAEGDPNCTAFDALPAANIPGVPAVTTVAATSVTSGGAQLNGTFNANGTSTSARFCYGTAADLTGCTTVNATPATVTGSSVTTASATLSGLANNTVYYFRAVGSSSKGTRYGTTLTFTTGSAGSSAPTATTVAASAVAGTTANLNGFVVPGGISTSVEFCYGLTSGLQGCTVVSSTPATVSGTTGVSVSAPLTGLAAGTTYYFEVRATNSLGSDVGSTLSFSTGAAIPPPTAVTVAASGVSSTTATLNGTVSANGDDKADITFCYGTTAGLAADCSNGTSVADSTINKNASNQSVSYPVSGLSPGTTYYFRVVATNQGNGVQGLGSVLSFVTGQGSQTITFTQPTTPAEITTSAPLVATATSGLPVSFASTTSSVCIVSGSTVNYLATGTCSLTADQAGNAAYLPAPQVSRTVTVTKRAQTITFAQPTTPRVVGDTAAVSASSDSGLTVTLAASPSSTCTLSGSTVTYAASGTCTLTATQAGNATFAAATTVVRTVTVTKQPQTITFAQPTTPRVIGDTAAVSATSDSGLTVTLAASPSSTCTLSGGTVTYAASGTCTLTATQAGNATFEAATSVVRTVTVSKKPQSINFTLQATGAKKAKITLTATATSGLAVTYTASGQCSVSGSTLTLKNQAGTCTVTAKQAGNATWAAATDVVRTLTVS